MSELGVNNRSLYRRYCYYLLLRYNSSLMWYKCIITILHWYFISVIYYIVLKIIFI
ncbi:hypothetical protein [Mudlarkpox virus]|nr:hypothetical protein [Mudlarkpox virus]